MQVINQLDASQKIATRGQGNNWSSMINTPSSKDFKMPGAKSIFAQAPRARQPAMMFYSTFKDNNVYSEERTMLGSDR